MGSTDPRRSRKQNRPDAVEEPVRASHALSRRTCDVGAAYHAENENTVNGVAHITIFLDRKTQ